MDTGQITQVADMGGEHSAGVCLVERDRGDVSSPSPTAKQRSLRVVYVLNDGLKSVMASSPESGALQCLQRACDAESALLTTVTFGRLDFGETSVLDSFYDAGVWDSSTVVKDDEQPSLFTCSHTFHTVVPCESVKVESFYCKPLRLYYYYSVGTLQCSCFEMDRSTVLTLRPLFVFVWPRLMVF